MDVMIHMLTCTSYAFTMIYGTQMEKPFPSQIVALGSEPCIIALAYLTVYYLSTIDVKVALAVLVAVLVVHIDSINLSSKKLLSG